MMNAVIANAFDTRRTKLSFKFHLGQVLATPGAIQAMTESGQDAGFFLAKHASGDWGSLSAADATANEEALIDGGRLLSSYKTLKGTKLWVITEAADAMGRRPATTILLPDEY
jgi:hypothetical protein